MLLVIYSGCSAPEELSTDYGQVIGSQGAGSLNGTSLFFDLFRERGFSAKRLKRISPRLDRYDTAVWFPDDHSCPSQEVIDAIHLWLEDGDSRTLIYVGRDYDASVDYFETLLADDAMEDRENLRRNLAQAKLTQDNWKQNWLSLQTSDDDECDWFEKESVPRHKSNQLSGPLTRDVGRANASLEVSTLLTPPQERLDDENVHVRSLILVDDQEFAYSLQGDSIGAWGGQIIIVNNGSFLLNYGLINPEHRKLANALIDECSESHSVVFLESGYGGIEVSDNESVNHNSWSWIARAPLRYIVPHFLMWGMLFCFVFYPIFGRPRRIPTENIATFRSHIAAMGKLLKRSGGTDQALKKVQEYQEHHGKELGG